MVFKIAHVPAVPEINHKLLYTGMRSCPRCPCPMYDNPVGVCYNCVISITSPPNAHPRCLRCDATMCSEHAPDMSIELNICASCRVPVSDPIANLTAQGIYIPSYTRERTVPRINIFRWRIQKDLVVVPPGDGRDKECVICTSTLGESQAALTRLICGHLFHLDCVVTWLIKSATCPICRHPHGTF
jgi:hypothetical protein